MDLDRSDYSDRSSLNSTRRNSLNDSQDAAVQADFTAPIPVASPRISSTRVQPIRAAVTGGFEAFVKTNRKLIYPGLFVVLAYVGSVAMSPRTTPTPPTVPMANVPDDVPLAPPVPDPVVDSDSTFDCQTRFEEMVREMDAKIESHLANLKGEAEVRRELEEIRKNEQRIESRLDEIRAMVNRTEMAVAKGTEGQIEKERESSKREEEILASIAQIEQRMEVARGHGQDLQVDQIRQELGELIRRFDEMARQSRQVAPQEAGSRAMSEPELDEHIHQIIGQELHKFNADKTGLADFALESAGAEILHGK